MSQMSRQLHIALSASEGVPSIMQFNPRYWENRNDMLSSFVRNRNPAWCEVRNPDWGIEIEDRS
jgi:hypothetical protein